MLNMLPIVIGVIAIGVALWHEWTWFRRTRHCVRHLGRIIAEHEEDGTPRWEIEYEKNGVTERFISGYSGSSHAKVGDVAHVVEDIATGAPEHLTISNRWILTIGPLLMGVSFLFAGLSMIWQEDRRQSHHKHGERGLRQTQTQNCPIERFLQLHAFLRANASWLGCSHAIASRFTHALTPSLRISDKTGR